MTALAFADPVFEAQAAFRQILRAMSSPGMIVGCGEGLAPPAPLCPAAAAALLTLADFETPLWIAPSFARSEARAFLAFHTGAPIAATPDKAVFALIDLEADGLDLTSFALGSLEYPDRSTTVVAQALELSSVGGFRLSGPGVRGERRLAFEPAPVTFAEAWSVNGARFPLGVDLLIAARGEIAALPRTAILSGDA
jgi:alpha-D-ribose 1-methylphosphonate 5-triphosphate synthase subunit PhnH